MWFTRNIVSYFLRMPLRNSGMGFGSHSLLSETIQSSLYQVYASRGQEMDSLIPPLVWISRHSILRYFGSYGEHEISKFSKSKAPRQAIVYLKLSQKPLFGNQLKTSSHLPGPSPGSHLPPGSSVGLGLVFLLHGRSMATRFPSMLHRMDSEEPGWNGTSFKLGEDRLCSLGPLWRSTRPSISSTCGIICSHHLFDLLHRLSNPRWFPQLRWIVQRTPEYSDWCSLYLSFLGLYFLCFYP